MNIEKQVKDFLCELISFPSTRGNETPVMHFLHDKLKNLVDECILIDVDDSLMDDPDYAFKMDGFRYSETKQLECVIRGTENGKKIVFNTHTDVVPPSVGQIAPFSARADEDRIFGRGACDAKGQIAVLYALILLIHESGFKPKGDLIFHFVIEEENGGNGTLAMVRRGIHADAAIVLEPSELNIMAAVRGAVWFELKVTGKPGHSGRSGDTISAMKKAYQAMSALEAYHDTLLKESRGCFPLFDAFENPMPITFGELHSGDWPATSPALAVVRGVFGFLPNKTRFEVQKEMIHALSIGEDDWLRDHFELSFPMLNSDGNAIDIKQSLVVTLQNAVREKGYPGEISAMTASCDAWFYNNIAHIPTVVFGAGSLKYAHSNEEQISLREICDAASILNAFVKRYC
jgi:acetylornithine deacetylase